MKVLKLRFDDGSEKSVSASDPDIRCVRTSDDLIVGDLCRYLLDGRLVTAEVLDVADIDTTDATQQNASFNPVQQRIIIEFTNLREMLKNDVVNEIQKLVTVVQNSLAPNVRIESQNVPSVSQPLDVQDILELLSESNNSSPTEVNHRRSPTLCSNTSTMNSEESHQPAEISGHRSIGRTNESLSNLFQSNNISSRFPSDALLRVKTLNGTYVPVKTMNYGDLVLAFEAKRKTVKLPPIAEKLNMELAVRRLRKPCLEAFNDINAKSFMYPIACYLFDLDILLTAFLPGKLSLFCKKIRKPTNSKKRRLNVEATDAFYFLVDYFSTILTNPSSSEHALWPVVVRHGFNSCVTHNESRGNGSNIFESHVIPGHRPIFNSRTAF